MWKPREASIKEAKRGGTSWEEELLLIFYFVSDFELGTQYLRKECLTVSGATE